MELALAAAVRDRGEHGLRVAALAARPETAPQCAAHVGIANLNGVTPEQTDAILARVRRPADPAALPYAIDAQPGDARLPDMTRFALDFLGDGFFLMVEGGRIDWAGHANEAAENLRDLLEMDDAVKVALDFQKSHPDTLVVVTGDHETGGMSMGFAGTGYAFYVERLASQKLSTETFRKRFHELKDAGGTFEDALAFVCETYGFKTGGDEKDPMRLSKDDIDSLRRHFETKGFADKAKRIMQAKAGVGWTSGSHTGLPAMTTSIGPGSELFTGLLDNTDIANRIKGFYK